MIYGLLWTLPFIFLLGAIAIVPLVQKHWWEKNFLWVVLAPALCILLRYAVVLKKPEILASAGYDYFSFICIMAALFTVSGGIHIRVKGEAKPWVNCAFLLTGAVLSNFLGTTGASMVLIRPWMRMNKYRMTGYHTAFFIFIIGNAGGLLTPVGNPPLFLGYLKGVPFFWTLQNLWPFWLAVTWSLLAVFFIFDSLNYCRAPLKIREKETAHEEWRFEGLHNLIFFAMIIGSFFIRQPLFLREGVMILAAFLSYVTTPKPVHEKNDFSFGPIREVAILFFGIFITMIPALEWLEKYASQIGLTGAGQYYWGSGILSSVLDNAPTYLNFLSAARGLFGAGQGEPAAVGALLAGHSDYIRAISVGSVLFGAVTYIGNGPNLLVKSVADRSGVKTPHFFEYIYRYSLPVLIPLFGLLWFFSFRP